MRTKHLLEMSDFAQVDRDSEHDTVHCTSAALLAVSSRCKGQRIDGAYTGCVQLVRMPSSQTSSLHTS